MNVLSNRLRRVREGLGLTQKTLAARSGITRQALIAIESGKRVPSTTTSMRLAQALGCSVEDLFQLDFGHRLEAVLAAPSQPEPSGGPRRPWSGLVSVGRVRERWVAHPIRRAQSVAADGLVRSAEPAGAQVLVEALQAPSELEQHVLVAGCAPVLSRLAQRVGRHARDARLAWVRASSGRALDLLEEGLVHVAGVHLVDARSAQSNLSVVRQRFPAQAMTLINLVTWAQGIVVRYRRASGLTGIADLARPGLRVARREAGSGSDALLCRSLESEGISADSLGPGLLLPGHMETAQAVAFGAADAGIAVESAALAYGLDFLPLAEERFDLVLPSDLVSEAPIVQLLETLDGAAFRREVGSLGGYGTADTGSARSTEAA
jgi:molybdate-binding protein/DNA-binding XRE family transcriptional regulator